MVDVLEPLGDETLAYLLSESDNETGEEQEITASITPDSGAQEETIIEITFDNSRISLFDTDSGEALVHGIMSPTEADGSMITQ